MIHDNQTPARPTSWEYHTHIMHIEINAVFLFIKRRITHKKPTPFVTCPSAFFYQPENPQNRKNKHSAIPPQKTHNQLIT